MKVGDLSLLVPFCYVTTLGTQMIVDKFNKSNRKFITRSLRQLTIGDIKLEILVPQESLTNLEPKTIANYSVDEVQTQIEKLNTLRAKRLKELQTLDNDIELLLIKQLQLKNQYVSKFTRDFQGNPNKHCS